MALPARWTLKELYLLTKDGEVIAKGYEVSKSRNFQSQFALCNRSHELKPGQARGVALSNLSIKARVQLLYNRLNHKGSVSMYQLIKKDLS